MTTYQLISTKDRRTVTGTLATAIKAAMKMVAELQPSHGVDIRQDGDLVATVGDAVVAGEHNDVADESALHIEEDILESLRDEAEAAGDQAQVAICERAIAGDAAAVLECVRVISHAQAQV